MTTTMTKTLTTAKKGDTSARYRSSPGDIIFRLLNYALFFLFALICA